nr:uncharacterized protein I206_06499 [Kwoniella pini CBS 10737]OCF47596.1 hypothetical protein I206_06499 [Kwoniella pini CBS 10737]
MNSSLFSQTRAKTHARPDPSSNDGKTTKRTSEIHVDQLEKKSEDEDDDDNDGQIPTNGSLKKTETEKKVHFGNSDSADSKSSDQE